jgi:histidine triad (HIT) family protein
MEDCIFCKIIGGQIPATKVYEDEDVLVFKDIDPVAPTHLLLIPKRHIATFNDIGPEDAGLLGRVLLVAKDMAADRNLTGDGYRLVMNCMPGAGQSVFHLHFHLLGGRIFRWPPG